MNTPRFSQRSSLVPSRRHGFTLIELLVVISIIGVLAGLLLPVISKVMDNAHKVDTKSTEMQIVSAVKSYQTEYGVYPEPAPTATSDYSTNAGNSSSSGSSNADLFQVLRATNNDPTARNTRRIVYFEAKDAKSLTLPKSGFVPSTATAAKSNKSAYTLLAGELVDAWGNRYFITMDSDYNDVVANPYSGQTDDPAKTDNSVVRTGVVVWTFGSDGAKGSLANGVYTGDDVLSWQ